MKQETVIFAGLLALGVLGSAPLAAQVPNVPIPNGRQAGQSVPPPAAATMVGAPAGGVSGSGMAGRTQPQAVPPQLLNSTEASIDQQTRGQFPTMDRSPSLPLGTLQRSWDRPAPASGQVAPGVVHYMWHPDFVMGVRTRDFMVTTVMLPAWERANEFYVGDPVVFEAKKIRSNVIAVRSRNAGADSNLTILGASSNVYNFYLRSETWNSTQVTDLTVYVDAPKSTDDGDGPTGSGGSIDSSGGSDRSSAYGAAMGMPEYLRKIVFKPEDLRFDMKMFVDKESDTDIAPERVFEDGVFTYFDFGERSDSIARPVVHHLVDGVDSVVNTRTAGPHGNILIAEAVGDFTLRNGNRVVCVKRSAYPRTATQIDVGSPDAEPRPAPSGRTASAVDHVQRGGE
ncbi:TrbG/VirB9 family P-type conjugative transfer protein [Telmatospirillum sp.]|uniref:TrbG/VirB9 family P-type conjugative transfer protein n=1 Tax=Telmatospirillum sp. TaxID=2079197 RepID=UPI00284DD88D|nr:TrbG/VirB9 family P-type conjugative transfer protein [Telmatospirillum sp.]MDR3438180.1 TrbG/VirB9 family P-type conjugative transfer protein [Telmatospirillum sp.]